MTLALRNRLEGYVAIYNSLLNREALQQAESVHMSKEISIHIFAKGVAYLRLLMICTQLSRVHRGHHDMLRWLGRPRALLISP